MGLLDAIGSFASPLLTAASNDVGAYAAGKHQEEDDQQSKLIRAIGLLRQKHQDEQAAVTQAATVNHLNAQAENLRNPPSEDTIFQDEQGKTWSIDKRTHTAYPVTPAGAAPSASPAPRTPNNTNTVEAPPDNLPPSEAVVPPQNPVVPQGGAAPQPAGQLRGKIPANPMNVRTPRTFMEDGVGVEGFSDPSGKFYHTDGTPASGKITPYVAPVKDQTPKSQIIKDDKTGEYYRARVDGPEGPLGATFHQGGAGGNSGSAQNMQARLLAAVSEGRLADQRMDAFTQKRMKNGKLDVGAFDQFRANSAINLAGSKDLTHIGVQALSESTANENDPEYMQFMRDARLISRAEQLMSARGGSEAMAQDNAFLARGGAHAPEATVQAASKTRKAMFGKMGAVMQTLSDDQKAKLAAGLDALSRDDPNFDYAGTGAAIKGEGGAVPVGGGRSGGAGTWTDPKTGRTYKTGP